jgi:hypothetical protein
MLDFPSSPVVGEKYPSIPVNGVPTYTWDGEKWTVANNNPPGESLPKMNGTAAIGTSESFSREDHIHPSDATKMSLVGGQTITGGFLVTPVALSAGAFTVNALLGNYQYTVNNYSFNITAPVNDCAVDILVTNGAAAGTITFLGFTVGSNTGDLMTTTNGHRFIISVRRINGISTYVIKALQ